MQTVRDNPNELRYELVDDRGAVVGEIRYRREPGALVLVHTEIDPAHEGHGLAGVLVADAFDDIRAKGLKVVPLCPYVRAWLRRHPEQSDLVTSDPATHD